MPFKTAFTNSDMTAKMTLVTDVMVYFFNMFSYPLFVYTAVCTFLTFMKLAVITFSMLFKTTLGLGGILTFSTYKLLPFYIARITTEV